MRWVAVGARKGKWEHVSECIKFLAIASHWARYYHIPLSSQYGILMDFGMNNTRSNSAWLQKVRYYIYLLIESSNPHRARNADLITYVHACMLFDFIQLGRPKLIRVHPTLWV